MKNYPSPLRLAEHEALSQLTLSGQVLDLGGEKNSPYLSYIQGRFNVITLNNDQAAKPDILHDLEKPLPVLDDSYDHVLVINVLEHIFDYHGLLNEAKRVLRPGGKIVVVVPFLFPIHPSPNDYWRFTGQALKKELELLGFSHLSIQPLGSGVFASRFLMIDRLLPQPCQVVNYWLARPLVGVCDAAWQSLAIFLGKKYKKEDYPLGYMVLGTV